MPLTLENNALQLDELLVRCSNDLSDLRSVRDQELAKPHGRAGSQIIDDVEDGIAALEHLQVAARSLRAMVAGAHLVTGL